jgi:hypothetical protein
MPSHAAIVHVGPTIILEIRFHDSSSSRYLLLLKMEARPLQAEKRIAMNNVAATENGNSRS